MPTYSDDLNRTGLLVGSTPPDGGPAWQSDAPPFWETSTANGGQAKVNTGNTGTLAYRDAGYADGTFSYPLKADAENCGLAFRIFDASSYWLVACDGSTVKLYYVAGSYAQKGSTYSGHALSGDVLEVVLSGPSITVYLNSTSIITYTDSTNASVTQHGYWNYDSPDDLYGPLALVPPPVTTTRRRRLLCSGAD